MRTPTRHILSALAIGTTLLAAGAIAAPAVAQSARPAQSTAAQPELSIAQISEKLKAAGYSGITDIERERDTYEVKATDKAGARVKLHVDPQSGNVLETRKKGEGRHERNDDSRN
ncbi:PepSY domain-containing protein [Janthinobacterium sp. 17J80-10]|uniref:PepSY domain-containing protein n=1 Tax=Janthinobacterium sp. 17J80-10 TaxID=2497863 RepID=UPI0010055E18|nr:PepSY domain-containing protein [Janthinobacterium sp. 17J80-10]QAU35074.1 PepSY domain-containing protein [Janthinobacterium sp. 17J80-10]